MGERRCLLGGLPDVDKQLMGITLVRVIFGVNLELGLK